MSGTEAAGTSRPSVPVADATLAVWVAEAAESQPDLKGWIDLIVQLRRVAAAGRDKTVEIPSPRSTFLAAAQLQAIVTFLQEMPCFLGEAAYDLDPLQQLRVELFNVTHGIVGSMLRPPPRSGGNPGNSSNFEMMKGQAARAMDELIQAKVPLKEAATKVARVLSVPSSGTRGRTITWKQVKYWRENLMAGLGPGVTEAALDAFRKDYTEAGATPTERARRLIEDLRQVAKAHS